MTTSGTKDGIETWKLLPLKHLSGGQARMMAQELLQIVLGLMPKGVSVPSIAQVKPSSLEENLLNTFFRLLPPTVLLTHEEVTVAPSAAYIWIYSQV